MTITAPAPGPATDPAPEPVSARPHWRRHRFADPKPPPRDKWHRQRHEDEFVALAEAQRISPAASWMHQVAIARTNPQLSDLQTTTLKDLAAAIGRSISSVTRYRRELKNAGVEEHEHRCVRNADGTILGLPNKIRFTLPPDAQARLDARTQVAELTRTKGRPTPKAPQNHPQHFTGRRPPAPEPSPRPPYRSFDDLIFCPTCLAECWFETSRFDGVKTCQTCQSALPDQRGP